MIYQHHAVCFCHVVDVAGEALGPSPARTTQRASAATGGAHPPVLRFTPQVPSSVPRSSSRLPQPTPSHPTATTTITPPQKKIAPEQAGCLGWENCKSSPHPVTERACVRRRGSVRRGQRGNETDRGEGRREEGARALRNITPSLSLHRSRARSRTMFDNTQYPYNCFNYDGDDYPTCSSDEEKKFTRPAYR